MELTVVMVVGCWRPLCGQTPGHFNTGWTQLVLASPCSVILDLTPSPLLFSRVPSFRAESAVTGQLVIQCAAAGTHRGLLTVTKFASVRLGGQEGDSPSPRPAPRGRELAQPHAVSGTLSHYHLVLSTLWSQRGRHVAQSVMGSGTKAGNLCFLFLVSDLPFLGNQISSQACRALSALPPGSPPSLHMCPFVQDASPLPYRVCKFFPLPEARPPSYTQIHIAHQSFFQLPSSHSHGASRSFPQSNMTALTFA